MHTVEIPEIKFKTQIPSEISELTGDQFVHFADELLKVYSKESTIDDLKISMVFKFLNIKHSRKKYDQLPEVSKQAIHENVFFICELLDYFIDMEDNKASVNLSFTKNFLPVLPVDPWKLLYGPADALTDLTFLEYKDANTWFKSYIDSQDQGDLNRMIAVLYRPKNVYGKKIKYDPEKVGKRARLIGKLPFKYRYTVYLFFSACEHFLHNGTINADGQEISLKILYEQTIKEKTLHKKQKYEANTGLAGIAYGLAKTGIFGSIEKVFDQNLYDVLLLLYTQRIEYLNQLENMDVK